MANIYTSPPPGGARRVPPAGGRAAPSADNVGGTVQGVHSALTQTPQQVQAHRARGRTGMLFIYFFNRKLKFHILYS